MSSSIISRLAQELVLAVVPELGDNASIKRQLSNRVIREVRADTHGGARKEWEDIRGSIEGLSRTAKVRIQEDLGEALEKNLSVLESQRKKGKSTWTEEGEVNMRNLPQYVHLLLNLAGRPTASTHDFAYSYLHRVPPTGPTADQILFREIMESEPFDPGEVWNEEVRSGWTESESDSDTDLNKNDSEDSPLEEEVKTPSSAVLRAQKRRMEAESREARDEDDRLRALDVVRGLKEGYWINPGQIKEMPEGLYGWKDLSIGLKSASIARALLKERQPSNKAITATQLQREVLFALSGRSGVMMSFSPIGKCSIVSGHPQVHHLTPRALEDILQTFETRSTQAAEIRHFVINTLQTSTFDVRVWSSLNRKTASSKSDRTRQAFAEACRSIMATFDTWLSDLEASFTRNSSAAAQSSLVPDVSASMSPLILRLELEKRYATQLDWLTSFIPHASSSVVLLDLIYATICSVQQTRFTAQLPVLHGLFLDTAQPTWRMVGGWLQYGMPIPSALIDTEEAFSTTFDESDERMLDGDFFIQRDRDVSWADEDFWESGYVIGQDGWPDWLGEEVGEMVLEAGKARGLLKSLIGSIGMVESLDSLAVVLDLGAISILTSSQVENPPIKEHLNIAERITSYLKPMCQLTQFHLRRVLDEECGLEEHLDAIEGLMYHRAFEIMPEWMEGLFRKVHNGEQWADFHTLTCTLREVVESEEAGWINPAAIRIRTIRTPGVYVGPRALGAIRASYEVPFPLSQLFTPTSIELRSEVFTFLLQMQMAQHLLTQTKEHDNELLAQLDGGGEGEIRAMWRMRQKILWFIDTIFTWFTARVIDVQTSQYRKQLGDMTSLNLMINLELEHTRKIRDYAFLHPATSELYEVIQDTFDLSHTLSECFTSYMAQSDVQARAKLRLIQKPKMSHVTHRRRKHRPRRQRRKSFSSDDDDDEEGVAREVSISFVELSLGQRMNRMEKDLQNAVAQIREGVEQMTANEDGEVWGMLAFALEEWK